MPLATKTSQRSDPSPSRVRLGPHRPYFTGGWFIGCSKFSTFLNYKCCCLHPNPRKNITTPGSKWIFNSKLRVSHNLCHRGNSYSNISFKDPNAISVIHLGTILDEGIVKEVAVETDLTTGGVGGVHGVRVPAKPQSTRGKSSTNNIFFTIKQLLHVVTNNTYNIFQYIIFHRCWHVCLWWLSPIIRCPMFYENPPPNATGRTMTCGQVSRISRKKRFKRATFHSTTPWKGVKPTASTAMEKLENLEELRGATWFEIRLT